MFPRLPARLFKAKIAGRDDHWPAEHGWIRDPQRFAVHVKVDPHEEVGHLGVGSQASLVVYTNTSGITDAIGRFWIGVVSYLTYLN